ncbi:unnamed protein product [Rangifer tarandus platyrhynchus]|uniref:Uncharacterized protein n=2 Tax=Rangifer tarandus platyrhynchus TaxID=3082113 RepID=A0AC59ZBG4_RANTA|nr:unnamed protein product [Rangifer tarandus platyrhynchus]
MKKKNDFSGPPPPQYVRAMRGHTQDPRILYVLPSTTNNIKCTPTRLSESTPDTSQRLCTLVYTQAYMKIRPDKHTCIFRSLHHKKKNCYLFSFHILGFQGWMRKEAVRKSDLFLRHPSGAQL